MKTAVYFLSLLCTVFLFGDRGANATSSHPKFSRQASLVKPVNSIAWAGNTEFKSSRSKETATDIDLIVAIEEDDEDEQELVGKQAPVFKAHMVVEALCALPPPVSISSRKLAFSNLPFSLYPCRYLVHRALLI
jgi:hypothetical protein